MVEPRKIVEDILTKMLKRIGKTYEELSPQAKATYNSWAKVLDGKPITPERLKDFLKGEKDRLVSELTTPKIKLNSPQDLWLKLRIRNYEIIVALIESPEKGAERFEEHLKRVEKTLRQIK